MKKLFFILTFMFFSLSVPARAACPDNFPPPEIELYSSYGNLSYDFSKNNQQITDLASRHGIMEKGLFASGLSTVGVNMDVTLKTIGDVIGEYDFCVYPKTVQLSIYFSDPKIYISKQLIPNSCEYNVVLRHEQTHQQINKTALDYFLPLFHQAAGKIAASVKPVNVSSLSDIDKASAQLTAEYNQKLGIMLDFFKQQLLNEQLKLDNQNNYQHENTLCR